MASGSTEEKFWPIFEAAEANDMTIYIHPQTPRPSLSEFLRQGMELAFYGFAVEVSTHMLAIIASGALDRFPKLRFVLGHLGEGLPYWLYRFDYMQMEFDAARHRRRGRSRSKLELKISDYIRRNVWATTSGMPAPEPIRFAQKQIGEDHVLYAMDYPYQNEAFEVGLNEEALTDANRKAFFEDNARRCSISTGRWGRSHPFLPVAEGDGEGDHASVVEGHSALMPLHRATHGPPPHEPRPQGGKLAPTQRLLHRRMGVVEFDMRALRPHRALDVEQRVGAERVFRESRLRRPEVRVLVRPARLVIGLPLDAIVEPLDLPDAVLADIIILVDARLPELQRQALGLVGRRFVRCRRRAGRGSGPWRWRRSSATVTMSCIWKWSSRKPSTGPGRPPVKKFWNQVL